MPNLRMAEGIVNKDLDTRFGMVNNYNSATMTVNFIVQSDGRLQINFLTGSDSRVLEFSETGVVREIKNGSVLWTK